MGRVVVFGSLDIDLVVTVPRHPKPGETLMGSDVLHLFGGKGANQAVAAAQAGANTVFIGKVGNDEPGRSYIRQLNSFGIDTSRMGVVEEAPTGNAIIWVDDAGENMIVVAPGANRFMTEADLRHLEDLGPGDVLLMPLELDIDVTCKSVQVASARGARIILNLAPFADLDAEILELIDPVIVNEHERDLLLAHGPAPRSLLVTLGEAGSYWDDIQIPAELVTVVDSTGAGDSYCGTLAARLAAGDDKNTAMIAATKAAAVCVELVGAQARVSTAQTAH